MKSEFRGLGKVFSFTFLRHIKSKGYRNTTIGVAILCILIPVLVMAVSAANDSGLKTPEAQPPLEEEKTNQEYAAGIDGVYDGKVNPTGNALINEIFMVDRTTGEFEEIDGFKDYAENASAGFKITDCGNDLKVAGQAAYGRNDALLMVVERVDDNYEIGLLIPEQSELTATSVAWVNDLFEEYKQVVKENWELDYENESEQQEKTEGTVDFTLMIVTFVNIMFMYFFVLLYGQGVATSVIMEKSSKLMEVFLITIKPTAMILGKLFAITLAGTIQLLSWVVSIIMGIAIGDFAAGMINPEAGNMISVLLELVKAVTAGKFTFGGAVLAVLVAISGILLYCSLAGIGGAMASKQEDLASTNVLFTLILIASYFAALFGGGIEGFGAEIPWLSECLDWIPFTAVLVLPARLLTGATGVIYGVIALAETVLLTLVFIYLSGRIYKATALYRGRIPRFKEIINMISLK